MDPGRGLIKAQPQEPGCVSPADGEQTLLDGVPLGLGEAAAFRQPVHGVEEGVDERGEGLRPREQRGTLGEEGEHGRAQVPVEGQGHVCGTEGRLAGGRIPG